MNSRTASPILNCLVFVATALFALPGRAQGNDENITYAFADVLSAEPWYETLQTREPVERCEEHQVRHEREGGNGALVGAVVGGVAGNQVGSGNGRRAATVAGAIIGGLVGQQADNNRRGQRYTTRETHCEVVDEVRSQRQLAGYEVQYRFRGEIYVSRLSYDPGSKLRIRIAVSPAEL